MKLNADVTTITSKDQGMSGARESKNAKTPARADSGSHADSAVKVNSPMLNQTKKILDEVSIVDKDRVKEIKERIKNGDYNVDPDKIADQMLRESIMENRTL